MHRWYADDGTLLGKIEQVKIALEIIAEQGAAISFIFNPTKKKTFWTIQDPFSSHRSPRR